MQHRQCTDKENRQQHDLTIFEEVKTLEDSLYKDMLLSYMNGVISNIRNYYVLSPEAAQLPRKLTTYEWTLFNNMICIPLRLAKQETKELTEKLALKEAEIEALNSVIAEKDANLEEKAACIDDLQKSVSAAKKEVKQLKNEITAERKKQEQGKSKALDLVYQSTSYKLGNALISPFSKIKHLGKDNE